MGRDIPIREVESNEYYFNPHARVGRDDDVQTALDKIDSISIHTPAWGVTKESVIAFESVYFNPHARVGRDLREVLTCPAGLTFQSTRPRGA